MDTKLKLGLLICTVSITIIAVIACLRDYAWIGLIAFFLSILGVAIGTGERKRILKD